MAIALIVLSLATAGVFAARSASQKSAGQSDATEQFAQQTVPLTSLSKQLGQALGGSNVLTVNGQLHVTGSLVFDPTVKPSQPTLGQIYFDQASRSLGYYNGKGFVYLQGGGNTFITNNVTNAGPVTNNNVTNVTNVSGGGLAGTGTVGTLALFTAPGTLGNSVITQSGTNLTVGSNSGASATTVQGGTAGVLITTADTAGTTGGITIQSGASSTTASGNISIDAGPGVITGTIADTRDFESGLQNFISWFGDTVTTSSAQTHGGAQSLAETGTGSNWGVTQDPNFSIIPVTAGHHYLFSAWVRAATTPRSIATSIVWIDSSGTTGTVLNLNPVTDSVNGWTQITGSSIAPAFAAKAYWRFTGIEAVGETHYFDDLVATDMSSSSATSELDLGATNAQIVTLGNMNEIGSTTISGGSGVNLQSGLAPISITGGALTISGQASSSIGTSAGSLTINSGGGSSGGVIIKPASDSTAAFQVQNAAGTTLLAENTSQSELTLTGGDLTINGVANPAAPTLSTTTGGSLSSGTYYYKLAALGANGYATAAIASSPASVSTAASGKNSLSWTNVANNAGYQLYQSTDGGATWLVRQLAKDATSYSDTSSTGWVTCGSGNPTCPLDNNFASSVFLQSGAPVVFDGVNGGWGATVEYIAKYNALITGNYNSGGAVWNQGDSFMFTDTTGYHNNFYIDNTGAARFSNRVNSTAAFQVQNASSVSLLTVDTTNMRVTVQNLVVNADLTVNGHIITGGSTPGIAAAAAACTSPTVTIAGTDTSGTITVTTGTGCTAGGTLATVTFAAPYASAPHVTITPGGPNAQALGAYIDDSTVSTTNFNLGTSSTPTATATYKWNYWVAQ